MSLDTRNRDQMQRDAARIRRDRERSTPTPKAPYAGPRRAPLPIRIVVGGSVRALQLVLLTLRTTGRLALSAATLGRLGRSGSTADPGLATVPAGPDPAITGGMRRKYRTAAAVREDLSELHPDGGEWLFQADASAPARPAGPGRSARKGRAAPAPPRAPRAPRTPRVLTPAQQRLRDRRRQLMVRRLRLAGLVGVAGLLALAWVKVPTMDAFLVRQVEITGTSAVPDLAVRRRVDSLLRGTTIFTVDTDAVRRRVEALPFVYEVRADRHFPGGLSLHVSEYEPLAFGVAGNGGWLVSRDGRVLVRGRLADWKDRIPVVRLEKRAVRAGQRLGSEPALRLLRLVPDAFPASVRTVDVRDGGIVAQLHDGPELRFGRDAELTTKLRVAERLLTMYGAGRRGSIVYLDVSVPERPASRLAK